MFWRSCAKMFGLTLSKALVMSIKTQAVNSLRAKPVQIVLVRMARLSAHDLNFLNPNWDIGSLGAFQPPGKTALYKFFWDLEEARCGRDRSVDILHRFWIKSGRGDRGCAGGSR